MDNFNFKKKYGQNFLKNENVLKRIADSASIQANSCVIEVGPGKGVLTKYLAETAKQVLCYEIDLELKDFLEQNLSGYSNILIKYGDFLQADIVKDLENFSYDYLYFVSNVPYYITTPILMKIISSSLVFSNIVMMVQKEVGERFSSVPGSKSYGSISVYLNYFYDVKKLFNVDRTNFVPAPNVDSVVVSLTPKKEKLKVRDLDFFFVIVRDSFQFKRKTLRNNLKKYNLDIILSVLQKYGYDLSVRAENLPVEVFVDLSNALTESYFSF